MTQEPWRTCPDCNCVAGEDHKRECPRSKWNRKAPKPVKETKND